MGTKNNPGDFECHSKADPDEPFFTLLGRDRHAGFLVSLWALLRQKDGEDEAVVNEAMRVAKAMEAHARGLGKHEDINAAGGAFAPILLHVTKGLDEHPEDFEQPCQCDLCLSYGD